MYGRYRKRSSSAFSAGYKAGKKAAYKKKKFSYSKYGRKKKSW